MGSPATPPPSAAFFAIFAAHADADETMPFARFMELALYHPEVGYYRRERARVGRAPGTDFFTASSSGTVFGELVSAACRDLLGDHNLRDHAFVEIGAESPESAVLTGVSHPFGAARTLSLGDTLILEGKCIVFSNELFDAQPCRRFVFRRGAWRELGVRLDQGALVEIELPLSPPSFLPISAAEGAIIDAPLAAVALLEKIAVQPWTGLFIACDYGKSWAELAEDTPAGTVRAYHRHRQSNDLLAQPGEQDLTCHVCWDWLVEGLQRHGFCDPIIESQESFFVRHASGCIAETTKAEAAHFSRKKLSLLQLLHPSNLGQKFQVLHALR